MAQTQAVRTANFGGTEGAEFDDYAAASVSSSIFRVRDIREITVSADTYVHRIHVKYIDGDGRLRERVHGGPGGRSSRFTLAADEKLIGLRGWSGALVDQLTFLTRTSTERKSYGPFGRNGGGPFKLDGDILAFYGRADRSYLTNIGCYAIAHLYGPFGGGGGQVFEDPIAAHGRARIKRIDIRHGAVIDAIQTTYENQDGSIYRSIAHGGAGGHLDVIAFRPGERITGVFGRSGAVVDSLAFLTEDELGIRRSYGPFGGSGGAPFIVNRDILSFVGRSGFRTGGVIDAIGFYTV